MALSMNLLSCLVSDLIFEAQDLMQKGFATKSDAENILKIPFRKNCQCQFFLQNSSMRSIKRSALWNSSSPSMGVFDRKIKSIPIHH